MLDPDHPGSAHTTAVWDAAVRHVIDGPPDWFPYGVPVVGRWHIPKIAAPTYAALPSNSTAHDKRGQATDPPGTVLHGYVQDRKLRSQMVNPRPFPDRFAGFWGVIPPDFSVRAQDPPDLRVLAIRMGRAVGAYYQTRGLRVIPNIRWCDQRDFDYCFDGIDIGSAVSVSNHGCWRDRQLRQGFLLGLHEMVERLAPTVLFVHGTVDHDLIRHLASRTDIVHLLPDRTRAKKNAA